MRRTTVFHLVLCAAVAGAPAAPAAPRRHAAAEPSKPRADRRKAAEDPCADLGRSDTRACRADQAKEAKAGREREARAAPGADPCAKLARRRRDSCRLEVEAAEHADARRDVHAGRKGGASPPDRSAAFRREVQPEDLIGGLEAPAATAPRSASGLRGSLPADVPVPVAAAPDRTGPRAGRRPQHLREVMLEDGQSLADLAARAGVSVADLARLNGLASVDDVPTGQALKLPPGAKAPPVRVAEAPPAASEPGGDASTPRPVQAGRPVRSAAASGGPRPYASLGPEGATPPAAPAAGRWGRTQADAMAAYAVASARAPRVADRQDATRERFVWPLAAQVVSAYGDHGAGRRNDGVDLAARPGDPVRASAAGEVVYAGKEIAGAGGNLVLLKHADGWVTAYSHLGRLAVAMRQTVEQGQEIAATPDVAGASVHFEVRQPGAGGAKPVDPSSVLPAREGGETGRGA